VGDLSGQLCGSGATDSLLEFWHELIQLDEYHSVLKIPFILFPVPSNCRKVMVYCYYIGNESSIGLMNGLIRDPMSQQSWIWSHDETFPSDAAIGKGLIDQLLAKLAELRWGEQDIFSVHLSVEEAVVNAIKHGNQNDQSKKVRVQFHTSADKLRIEIEDEGDGFDPDSVPDPTFEENLELPSGRGLMLMRNFMTRIEFNDKGNQVVLEKRRSDSD